MRIVVARLLFIVARLLFIVARLHFIFIIVIVIVIVVIVIVIVIKVQSFGRHLFAEESAGTSGTLAGRRTARGPIVGDHGSWRPRYSGNTFCIVIKVQSGGRHLFEEESVGTSGTLAGRRTARGPIVGDHGSGWRPRHSGNTFCYCPTFSEGIPAFCSECGTSATKSPIVVFVVLKDILCPNKQCSADAFLKLEQGKWVIRQDLAKNPDGSKFIGPVQKLAEGVVDMLVLFVMH
jgi:hypothetical protein